MRSQTPTPTPRKCPGSNSNSARNRTSKVQELSHTQSHIAPAKTPTPPSPRTFAHRCLLLGVHARVCTYGDVVFDVGLVTHVTFSGQLCSASILVETGNGIVSKLSQTPTKQLVTVVFSRKEMFVIVCAFTIKVRAFNHAYNIYYL